MFGGSWFAAEAVRGIGGLSPAVQLLTAGAVVALVAILVSSRQSSRRLPSSRPGVPGPLRRDLDDCWKFGVFYYNPDDPTIFVEKRFGVGYTLNFAQPWAWVMLIVILVSVIALVILVRRLVLPRPGLR